MKRIGLYIENYDFFEIMFTVMCKQGICKDLKCIIFNRSSDKETFQKSHYTIDIELFENISHAVDYFDILYIIGINADEKLLYLKKICQETGKDIIFNKKNPYEYERLMINIPIICIGYNTDLTEAIIISLFLQKKFEELNAKALIISPNSNIISFVNSDNVEAVDYNFTKSVDYNLYNINEKNVGYDVIIFVMPCCLEIGKIDNISDSIYINYSKKINSDYTIFIQKPNINYEKNIDEEKIYSYCMGNDINDYFLSYQINNILDPIYYNHRLYCSKDDIKNIKSKLEKNVQKKYLLFDLDGMEQAFIHIRENLDKSFLPYTVIK